MTNHEKYKQAFSVIHTSHNFSLEVEKMEKTKKRQSLKTMVAVAAACVMLVGGATTAYALDLGGIQRTLQIWMQGDQTEVIVQFDGNGSYSMQYTDSQGNEAQQGGGGVAIEEDGSERPLSEEELMQGLTDPEVSYEDDGSVWIYWFDQRIEITDKFENDVCYVQLEKGGETLYMTVKYQNGYAMSSKKYASPSTFNLEK